MMLQCPFCMEEVEGDETERLAHCLDKHSTALFMAQAILHQMPREGVAFESDNERMGYREWLAKREAS